MRLCDRLAQGEDADALARVTLDTALQGLRAGAAVHTYDRSPSAFDAESEDTTVMIRKRSDRPCSAAALAMPRLLRRRAAANATSAAGSPSRRRWPSRGRRVAEPVHRSLPARHRIARRRRTRRRRRGNRRPRDRHAGRARHARRRRRGAGPPLGRPKRTRRCAKRRPTPRSSKRVSASRAAQAFDPGHVPEVLNAKASLDWAEADFNRIKSLLDQKVVSQAEYDQKLTQVQAARQQYQVAQNAAQQSFRSLAGGARARRSRAQGRGRHRRPRAVRRHRRRAARRAPATTCRAA